MNALVWLVAAAILLSQGVQAQPSGPQRLADGSVFLPKPAQRQLGLRTAIATEAELPRSIELSGRVVMDPNAGGKVQAMIAGRLEPGPQGLPGVGQSVKKGELLAWVTPSAGQIERSNQSAQLAELGAAKALAEKRVARLRELADTVPRKEIEAAESELASLRGRATAIAAGLTQRDPLRAPVAGVIASAHAVAGQVLDARELVFEVVDPARLRVEALAYDAAMAQDIGGATLNVGGVRVTLAFVGAGRILRDQALPLLFRAEGPALTPLAVGQPVKVFAQTLTKTKGIAIPASALVRSPSNQTIVWVKSAPERFEPRVVSVEPVDGVLVLAIAGLKAGERITTLGATLLNQVR